MPRMMAVEEGRESIILATECLSLVTEEVNRMKWI